MAKMQAEGKPAGEVVSAEEMASRMMSGMQSSVPNPNNPATDTSSTPSQ